MLFLKFTLSSSQAFCCLGQRPVPSPPRSHGSAAGHQDAKPPEQRARASSHQPSPATTNLPSGAARASVPVPAISCHPEEAQTALGFTPEVHF